MSAIALGLLVWYLASVASRNLGRGHPDFEFFYKAGASVLAHGDLDRGVDQLADGRIVARGALDWYLPFVSRIMTLFAWLPLPQAGGIWLLLNLTALIATLRLVGRHFSGLPPRDWPATQLLPFLFLIVFWHWEFRLNQINNFTLLLLLGAFVCWRQGRPTTAGLWLGLAVLLKVTPLLLVLWFALKRQFRVVAVAAVTFLAAGPLADTIAFSPSRTVEMYRAWGRRAVVEGSHRGLILGARETDWRNQSLSAVAMRWLYPANWNTHFDNDPRITPRWPERTLNIVHLPRPVIAALVTGIVVLSAAGLVFLARRPAHALTLWQLRLEFALFILAMLWFMPVMRRYHLIWCLPALSVLAGCIHYSGFRGWWARLALAAFLGILISQLLLLTRVLGAENFVEAGGVFLAAVALLAAPLIAQLLILSRRPAALPPDKFALQRPEAALPRDVGRPAADSPAGHV